MPRRTLIAVSLMSVALGPAATPGRAADAPAAPVVEFVTQHCLDCHGPTDPESGLNLQSVLGDPVAIHGGMWEKVVRKLNTRQMPPAGADRPAEAAYTATLDALTQSLDAHAAEHPHPGRTETFRRLTRTEYQHAIRDLLALDIDLTTLLPADEASHGFDNVTVGELSPTLLNRYIAAAQQVSRLAIGAPQRTPGGATIRVPPDVTQENWVEGLPFGTRGGTVIPYTFPQDGEYEIQVRLTRDRNEHVEGLNSPHRIELLLDRAPVQSFTVNPPKRGKAKAGEDYDQADHEHVDRHLQARLRVTAGPHRLGVTFVEQQASLLETQRQPLNVHFNMYRHPRQGPAVYQVSIIGPFDPTGPGETPSRRRVFTAYPATSAEEDACAQAVLSQLLRRAYRRPIDEADLKMPLELFRERRDAAGFEAGIELALSAILVNPNFLFRIERDPPDAPPQSAYRVSDVELASRMSFFLWSSLPDDELLDLAEQGRLSDPAVLAAQTRRMLADERALALVTNFADQWLHLRNLDSITPDARLYPDFDDNLRQAFRRETELVFENLLREDRSVSDLLKSDFTYLNERLAKHYGIPHVYGSQFRKVMLDDAGRRGGLLRHGSILTVTSYATRTSPVLRGKWILENVLGTPPPPPPSDVPALKDNTVAANLSVRERLAQHRAQAACAVCHDLIDPIGFSLENFDAVGRWRELEEGRPVDATGGLPGGSTFVGIDGLEAGLLAHPEWFAGTISEKLLTYALGRGVEHADAPAVRRIVRDAAAEDYRLSSLIVGIVQSVPFQMRMSP